MTAVDANQRPAALRVVSVLVLASVVGVGIWALFRWVVEDPELLLRYVKAVTWPLIVLLSAYWLRDPIRAKVGQLLRVEGFGASMAFQESPGDQLGRRLQDDVDELGLSEGRVEAGNEEDTPSHPAADAVDEERPETVSEEPRPNQTAEALVQMFDRFALVLNLGDEARASLRHDLETDPQLAGHKLAREMEARESVWKQKSAAPAEDVGRRRDSVESIIRNSADWGYDLGRSGAPRTVPDIHWNNDGTWKITTEVPAPRKPRTLTLGSDHNREIRELVDEIKSIEKRRHGALRSVTAMSDMGWLSELKRRLRMIDPGNPWAQD